MRIMNNNDILYRLKVYEYLFILYYYILRSYIYYMRMRVLVI